ncbi:hypothetical protein [Peribacillus muralis]|uniref:hypothetical protein n=1 Tax=Peribacillus muralis TaxID=264697 RepID=UPI00366A8432
MKIKDDDTGEEVVYINPDSFKQSLELSFTLSLWNFTGRKKNILLPNEKKQNFIFFMYIAAVVVAVGYSIYSIFTVLNS